MTRNFQRILILTLVLLGLFAAVALGAEPARQFVPVQDGYAARGRMTEIYHPTRLLIKFTADASENAKLNLGMYKGASIYGYETGLNSVDNLTARYGVQSISRPFIRPQNEKEADRLGLDRWYQLEIGSGQDLIEVAKQFESDPNIEAASPDWVAFPAAVPNDPLHSDHWGHNNTAQLPDLDWGGTYEHTLPNTVGTVGFDSNAQPAWDASQGYGSSSVVIAILDSGVDVGHPDLNQVTGYDYGDNDSNPDDNSGNPGHGTACAGVAAAIANNGLGSAGIAGGCSIMPLKVANSAGSMYFSAIIDAIYHAADNGADIISMSLGAAISSDSATDAAIQYAYNAGVTLFAATGNENASTISYPAINVNVISVGAASPCGERKRSSSSSGEVNPGVNTDPNGYTCDGERWWGSNYGTTAKDTRTAVDILGPTILPTTDIQGSAGYDPGNYSGFFNGTSCATPYVAGVAALVKSQNPGWTPAQIRAQLTSTAEDVTSVESGTGWDRYSGYGMVDAAAAVGGGGSSNDPPVAAFTGSPTSGLMPLNVSFTDQSTNSPTGWSWTFGDGGSSGSQNPSHTYTAAGTYTVTLTASNAYGSDGETKTGYITVTDPGDTYASLPYNTGFETGSLDQYWSTTLGAEGRIQVTSSYTPRGGFHLVMDDHTNGGSYSQNEAWLQLNLSGESQVDLGFWWKDFSDETHSQDGVYFSDNGGTSFVKVQDLNGASYTNNTWNEFTLDLDALASANGLSLSSTFVVKFQQYDNYAATTDGMAFDDISVTSGATGTAPTAAFAGSPTSGVAPLAVNFTDQSTDGPTSWSWTFGDGGTSTAQNPSHSYTSAGTYNVTLTVSNAFGSDPETKNGYITVTAPGVAPVAAFTGNPTSGVAPLAVTFTDQSTNTPTSWSWTFGDGGTSTAQNPSHSYTAAGTYNVTLTATNAFGSDAEVKNGYIVVTSGGGGTWQTITYDDFEGGWGSYSDGGGDCALYTSGTYSHQGAASARIRDNSGVASSFFHTSGHDVSGYVDLEVDFWFVAVSMDNTREDFWLQYFDGSSWQTIETWARSTDFDNGVFYHKTVTIPNTYNYPANAQLRFMCDASGNRDYVYIDEVEFRGLTAGGTDAGEFVMAEKSLPTRFDVAQNYPNPFNPSTTIKFSVASASKVRITVYDLKGAKIADLAGQEYQAGEHSVTWNAQGVPSGAYFYRIQAGTFDQTKRMMLLK